MAEQRCSVCLCQSWTTGRDLFKPPLFLSTPSSRREGLVWSLSPRATRVGWSLYEVGINFITLFQKLRRQAMCRQKSTKASAISQESTWAAVPLAKEVSKTPKVWCHHVYGELWNGEEMLYWVWFLHYPVAFRVSKGTQILFFLEKREHRFTDFITNLKQIEQKPGESSTPPPQSRKASFKNQRTSAHLSTFCRGLRKSVYGICVSSLSLLHFQKLNKKWRYSL